MEFLLILMLVVIVTGVVFAFVAPRQRKRKPELEPGHGGTAVLDLASESPAAEEETLAEQMELGREALLEQELEAELAAEPEVEEPAPAAAPAEPEVLVKPRFRDRLGKAPTPPSGHGGPGLARSPIDNDNLGGAGGA